MEGLKKGVNRKGKGEKGGGGGRERAADTTSPPGRGCGEMEISRFRIHLFIPGKRVETIHILRRFETGVVLIG